MIRHSKVFVQVSEASENSFSLYTAYSIKEWVLLEEKENVYVLTEDELKEEKKKEAIAFAEWKDNNFFTDENILPYLRQYQVSKDYVEGDAKLFDYKDIYELFNQQK